MSLQRRASLLLIAFSMATTFAACGVPPEEPEVAALPAQALVGGSCTVSRHCPDNTTVSCSGASCTSAAEYVSCDGARTDCPPAPPCDCQVAGVCYQKGQRIGVCVKPGSPWALCSGPFAAGCGCAKDDDCGYVCGGPLHAVGASCL